MMLELGDAEGRGLEPHLPPNFQGLQTKTKNKKRETMIEEVEAVLEKVFVCFFFFFTVLSNRIFWITSSFFCTNWMKHLAAAISQERCHMQPGCLLKPTTRGLSILINWGVLQLCWKSKGKQRRLWFACVKIRCKTLYPQLWLACNSPEAGLFLNLWCRDWGYLKLVVTVGDMMLNEKEKIVLNTNF